MPLEPKVKINKKDVADVLDVTYSIGSGWDRTTGHVRGEVAYSPLKVVKMMTPDSYSFFRSAAKNDTRFPVELAFSWQNPTTNTIEEYVWITLTEAVMLNYSIQHQDWKEQTLNTYNPIEVLTLGYKKLKIKTADGEYEVEFKPKKKS